MSTTPSTVRFTEEMKGHVTFGETDPEEGRRQGETYFMFHLTIETDDIDRFYHQPEHVGAAEGWVRCDRLGGQLAVERGVFNLFVDTDRPDTKEMRYRLWFRDRDGQPLTFTGVKYVHDDKGLDMWPDTSTLYSRIYEGHIDEDEDGGTTPIAAGVLRILVRDFAKQLTTFRSRGPSLRARARAFALFLGIFGGKLFDVFARRKLKLS